MGPYTHFVLAHKLAARLHPPDADAYTWGAIVPDIRYLAEMKRSQTHLPLDRLRVMGYTYPYLKSFLLGYQVHCLIDELDVLQVVGNAFPLNCIRRLTRKAFSAQQLTMMVELYYLHTPVHEAWMSGSYNEILAELEIDPDTVWAFSSAMQQYIARPSFETALAAFTRLGMMDKGHLDKYISAYRSLENKPLLKSILFWSICNARLDQHVIQYVFSGIQPFFPAVAAAAG